MSDTIYKLTGKPRRQLVPKVSNNGQYNDT